MNRKIIILLANILFYALLDFKYLGLILFEIIITYCLCYCMHKSNSKKKFLVIGVAFIVFALVCFKYLPFIVQKYNLSLRILMPLGISYYSFKIISYMVDMYRGKLTYHVSLLDYAVYVSFFPQIICGPISRADEILGQLKFDCHITKEKVMQGIGLIISGAFKKYVIADRLAGYIMIIFGNPYEYPALAAWLAAFFFSIQIYCDFAGYSEMAIGICNIIGFRCKPNFRLPYFSYSIKEFWNRWHISLSTWLRDYIYIPLGGNRQGKVRKNVNIIVTFLISGIWHGNSFNFICWGLFHGICNIFSFKAPGNGIDRFVKTVVTFILVSFGWIVFYVDNMKAGVTFIVRMFTNISISYDNIVASILPFTNDYSCLAYFLCICIFIFVLFVFEWNSRDLSEAEVNKCSIMKNAFYLVSIILFGCFGTSSFLYANF